MLSNQLFASFSTFAFRFAPLALISALCVVYNPPLNKRPLVTELVIVHLLMASSKFRDICNASNFKNLTTLIFDMDNTLIPTRKGDLKTCNKVSPGNCHFLTHFISTSLHPLRVQELNIAIARSRLHNSRALCSFSVTFSIRVLCSVYCAGEGSRNIPSGRAKLLIIRQCMTLGISRESHQGQGASTCR